MEQFTDEETVIEKGAQNVKCILVDEYPEKFAHLLCNRINFTKSSQKISTHLLTVLINGAIT